jgi:hypothetical protein
MTNFEKEEEIKLNMIYKNEPLIIILNIAVDACSARKIIPSYILGLKKLSHEKNGTSIFGSSCNGSGR